MLVPQSVTDLCNEVTTWMDGQRDQQFPFCDTYLMWQDFDQKLDRYNCTLPYWRKHGNTVMEDIAIKGDFKEEIRKIIIVKGTAKGIALPCPFKSRESYYVVKKDTNIVLGKSYNNVLHNLEVPDYKLYSWKSKELECHNVKEGTVFSTGNLFAMNAHIQEGAVFLYVKFKNQ